MDLYTDFLAQTELFHNLNEVQFALIESICEAQTYQREEIIFTEGSQQSELYLILNGLVEILIKPGTTDGGDQKPEVIATLHHHQCFGEMALVDESARSATARAATANTRLLRITRSRLLMMCDSYPDMGYKIMRNFSHVLAEKVRSTNLRVREEMIYRKLLRASPTLPIKR